MALPAPMDCFRTSAAHRPFGYRGILTYHRSNLACPRCTAWSELSPVAILDNDGAPPRGSSSTTPLDFEYTTYAIKNASSAHRPGRMDRSKLRPSRRGALKHKSSKGFLAFETWTGNAAILKADEADEAAAASASPAAPRSHAARAASSHGPVCSPMPSSSPERNQQLQRSLSRSYSALEVPCRMGLSTSSFLKTAAEASAAFSGPQQLHGAAALTATALCSSFSGTSSSSSSGPATLWPSSSGPFRSSSQQAQRSDVSSACTNARSPSLGQARRGAPAASSSGPCSAQQGGSNRDIRLASASLRSRSAARNPQPQKSLEKEEEQEEEEEARIHGAAEASSSSCPSPSQWRLVGGSHALGINPRRAASDPALKAALEGAEPRDVRRCVRALRRCLGGLPFKRVAAIVQMEPRLIGKSEAELAMQVEREEGLAERGGGGGGHLGLYHSVGRGGGGGGHLGL